MKPWQDFVLRLAVAIAAMFLVAPLIKPLLPDERIHRILTRTLQVSLVIALLVRRGSPRTWPAKLAAMGLRGPFRLRRFGLGAGAAALLIAAALGLTWALGGRDPVAGHRLSLAEHVAAAAFAGVMASVFEEVLVRGYLKDALGGLASAALFAGVHYFRPLEPSPPAGPGFEPLFAFENVGYLFEAWTDPRLVTMGNGSLLLLALALNRLRERTGTLYLGIGVHAGMVFCMFLYRRFLDDESADPWIWGGSRLHDGLVGVLAMGLLLAVCHLAPLPRWALARNTSDAAAH